MRTAITAATFLALQGATTPFAGIPNVRIEDYPVSGRSVATIRRSIDAARPTDPNDHRVDGLTRWNINWRWRRDAAGTCTTTLDAITFSAVVTVPRLSDPDVPPAFAHNSTGSARHFSRMRTVTPATLGTIAARWSRR